MVCFNSLIRPTEIFWNRFTAPCYPIPRDLVIADLAMRSFSFLGTMLTLPLYFVGRLMITFCSCYLSISATSYGIRLNREHPAIRQIRTEEIQQAENSLRIMKELLANPSWESFRQLPFEPQYLIAGIYTYPYFWGWNFSTKYTLMKEFESRLKFHPNLSEATNAIRDAIQFQEKIVFVLYLKESIRRARELDDLRNHDPATYRQALHFIAREHNCRRSENPLAFAEAIIRNQPENRDTLLGIDSLLRHLKDAYSIDFVPEMREAEQ